MTSNTYNYLNPTEQQCQQALQELMKSDNADVRWFTERSLSYVEYFTTLCRTTPEMPTVDFRADHDVFVAFTQSLQADSLRSILRDAETRVSVYEDQMDCPRDYLRHSDWSPVLRHDWELASHAARHLVLIVLATRRDLQQALCYSIFLEWRDYTHNNLALRRRLAVHMSMVDPWLSLALTH